jgi:hypothetical protein
MQPFGISADKPLGDDVQHFPNTIAQLVYATSIDHGHGPGFDSPLRANFQISNILIKSS